MATGGTDWEHADENDDTTSVSSAESAEWSPGQSSTRSDTPDEPPPAPGAARTDLAVAGQIHGDTQYYRPDIDLNADRETCGLVRKLWRKARQVYADNAFPANPEQRKTGWARHQLRTQVMHAAKKLADARSLRKAKGAGRGRNWEKRVSDAAGRIADAVWNAFDQIETGLGLFTWVDDPSHTGQPDVPGDADQRGARLQVSLQRRAVARCATIK